MLFVSPILKAPEFTVPGTYQAPPLKSPKEKKVSSLIRLRFKLVRFHFTPKSQGVRSIFQWQFLCLHLQVRPLGRTPV